MRWEPGRAMTLAALATVSAVLLALPNQLGGLQSLALAQQTPSTSAQVRITDTGFDPTTIDINPGDSVHWTNVSTQTQTVTSADGLLDSGALAPGSGFSVTLATPGDHAYTSSTTSGFTGMVRVGAGGLSGPLTDLANNHLPRLDFPRIDPADVGTHPILGAVASRTHILLGFTSTATVGQANTVLRAANVTILGGIPKLNLLLVGATSTPDFTGLDAALQVLDADPAVELATLSVQTDTDVVPRPAEDPLPALPPAGLDWQWSLSTIAPDDAPFGDGGAWGLKASRFPQAWNLLETIRRKNSAVDTVVMDHGFQFGHADLTLRPLTLCTTILHKCTSSGDHDHGNHVAGIIGATYDNAATEGRSRGISGANPVAHMFGVPVAFDASPTGLFETSVEVWDLVLEASEEGTVPNLRVINHSMGIKAANLPLGSVVPIGKIARTIAERASRDNVLIVQSAGNDSSAGALVQAARTGGFKWAAANWVASSPNPIIVVEAIGNDDPTGVFPPAWQAPSLSHADFSNGGGNVSAPGVRIGSTGSSIGDSCFDRTAGGGRVDDRVEASGVMYCPMDGTSMAAPFVTGLVGYLLAYDPSLDIPTLRNAIIGTARGDTTGAAPRIDAFAALMSLPSAARPLVDINDMSPDGNRRVVLGRDNTELASDTVFSQESDPSTGKPYLTAPDGRIDMRDFRRFRDAWLQVCQDAPAPGPGCPSATATNITLNGVDLHPKKDLNFDGCVYLPAADDPNKCITPESEYPRFDFNGDGFLSIADLNVFQGQFGKGTNGGRGHRGLDHRGPWPPHAGGRPRDSRRRLLQ